MKVTTQLKSWLHDNAGLSAEDNLSDTDYTKAAAEALASDKLSPEKYAELTKDPDSAKALTLQDTLNELIAAVKGGDGAQEKPASGTTKLAKNAPKMPSALNQAMADSDGEQSGSGNVNVVTVDKMYDTTRKEARYPSVTKHGIPHPAAGQRVTFGSQKGGGIQAFDEPSDLDMAITGAHFKKMFEMGMRRAGIPFTPELRCMKMTEHEEQLWMYSLHNSKWCGVIGGEFADRPGTVDVNNRQLSEMEIKAIIDDATSGGSDIVPIEFDTNVILPMLLHGEFAPLVETVNINRGRVIESGAFGTVTISSGGVDASAIPLFNTANYISAFNTTIHRANAAIEIGLDFLSDSPVDVGGIVSRQYGEVFMQWLDEQVCVGDGTTEPEGVVNASGITSVSAANGNPGPPTVGDYEGLLFAIPKQYNPANTRLRTTFGATQATYRKARGIAVSGTDQRRVFGTVQSSHGSYMLLEHPYRIGEFFTNAQILFCNWSKYRLYRRMGMSINVERGGKELVLNNLLLITMMARYGGQLTDSNAAALVSNADTT